MAIGARWLGRQEAKHLQTNKMLHAAKKCFMFQTSRIQGATKHVSLM